MQNLTKIQLKKLNLALEEKNRELFELQKNKENGSQEVSISQTSPMLGMSTIVSKEIEELKKQLVELERERKRLYQDNINVKSELDKSHQSIKAVQDEETNLSKKEKKDKYKKETAKLKKELEDFKKECKRNHQSL